MSENRSKTKLDDLNPDKKHSSKQKNQKSGDQLINLVKNKCELFSNFERKAYAKFTVDDHKEVYAIKSQEFIDYLNLWYYRETQRAPSKTAIETAISSLSAIARFDGLQEPVYIRVAQIGQTIYIDLCNKKWQVVKVSFNGVEILNRSPVAFTRNNKMKSLPIPSTNPSYDDNVAKEDIRLILNHINIKEDQLPLVTGWLLMSMQRSKASFPVMLVNGPAGSGKSTACEMFRELIDPNYANLTSQPKTSEIRVVGEENYILAFDNVSRVSPNFSDALCRISTGDNQIIRQLHTTNSSYTISMHNPIIINGIPEFAKRADLVSRSIKVSLRKIIQRKTTEQSWEDFNNDKQKIFSALLYGLCISISSYKNIKIENMTRMSDFCKLATAAHLAYHWNQDDFMDAYNDNIKLSHIDSLESSLFTTAIITMFENENYFNNRPIELLRHLESKGWYEPNRIKRVSSPKGVVEALDRAEDSLEAIGIIYEKYKDNTNKTFVKIERDESLVIDNTYNYQSYKEPYF